MIVLFALCLIAIIAMAGLLVDGGMAWANRRQAQAAADTAALAAAKAIVANQSGSAAALAITQQNGFGNVTTDCSGATLPGNAGPGVQVNNPPSTGPHSTAAVNQYVEVITTRKMTTTFAAAVGQSCWMVSARAVASIGSSSVASCNFCSLNNTTKNHTILLQGGSLLRVDGDIYTNSYNGCVNTSTVNGLVQCNDAATCALNAWKVCGDAFDVFGTPPTPPAYISAKTISVVGGWETHDQNIVTADSLLAPNPTPPPPTATCPYTANPPSQAQTSNVCIHMPPIVDPFAGVPVPQASAYTVPTSTSCSAAAGTSGVKPGSGTVVTSITSGSWTICPGKYYGISITGQATQVVMQSGVYYMTTKGFVVGSGGSVDGSSGVMIFNTGGGAVNITQLDAGVDIQPDPDLAVVTTNPTTLTASQATFQPLPPNPATAKPTVNVQYQFKVTQPAGKPTFYGTVTFYDGDTNLNSSCGAPSNLVVSNKGTFTAKCTITYGTADVGTHAIEAVYSSSSGHPDYNDAEGILSPREVITVGGVTGGTTALKAMSSGPYAGFVIWQDKNSNVNMVISPVSALPDCSGTWMTDGVPPNTASVPAPCGDLGGISGTIYAGYPTAQVQVTASGLADMQIVAGMILITNGTDARFAFKASAFALGSIRLVE
jgi:hypothetical protein